MGQLSGTRRSLCCGSPVMEKVDTTMGRVSMCTWCGEPCTPIVEEDEGIAAEDDQMQEDEPYPGYGAHNDSEDYLLFL